MASNDSAGKLTCARDRMRSRWFLGKRWILNDEGLPRSPGLRIHRRNLVAPAATTVYAHAQPPETEEEKRPG